MPSRSTSAENVKMNSDEHNGSNDSSSNVINMDNHRARSEDKQNSFRFKNSYSTMPHNARALRQIQQQLNDGECESQRKRENEFRQMSQSFIDDQLTTNDKPSERIPSISMPSSPIIHFKSSAHGQPSGAITFGKTFFWLRKSKRATSAPELGELGFPLFSSFNLPILLCYLFCWSLFS